MNQKVSAYAAKSAGAPLGPFDFEARSPREDDVAIDILFCGICHSDVHQVRNEWGNSQFPMVPGHEIIGRVTETGAKVQRFQSGDLVGVGCMVHSCQSCAPCHDHLEQFCEKGPAFTYNSTEMDRKTPTYGGYATKIVVREAFVLRVDPVLDPARAAPLLCAGITTYSPLRQWNCKAGDHVAVVGLGGLGHMAVKLAASMGAEVTVLSSSPAKERDAKRLGAHGFEIVRGPQDAARLAGRFNLIIDSVSAPHDYNAYLSMLRVKGVMVLLGVPPEPMPVGAFSLIGGNRRLAGSLIGGIQETQEMLDYCAAHKIEADIEIVPAQKINEAYERMMKSDVRYRFVIDIASLKA
ncbi:MAG: NAD(P)-dependent alcohol dehydrogenase [Deltaproteobacteria bacterium]|nr:NAD(P)-dependent alcohol dehydrogenase [Deltaproteobacteria bacterium]